MIISSFLDEKNIKRTESIVDGENVIIKKIAEAISALDGAAVEIVVEEESVPVKALEFKRAALEKEIERINAVIGGQ